MSNLIAHRSTHSARLERWAGKERLEDLSNSMRGWYYKPIPILDLPGNVRVGGDGDFHGPFERGMFASALDVLEGTIRRAMKVPRYSFHTGFTSINDAFARGTGGFSRRMAFNKAGTTGVVAVTNSLHKVGAQPVAGTAASAAPGGRALVDSDTGGMPFDNPAVGHYRLTGADVGANLANTLLLYDRIFDVAKTMNSTATESVTGVPTRYQSSTVTAEDYAGGNFLFVEVGLTALAATAHNWTTCLYRNQAGTDAQTLPSLTGNSGAIIHRLDHPTSQWFAPLASGDSGVMDLNQMQCSAAVATGLINFVIGHPIGTMLLPLVNLTIPFNWITSREPAPRIFNDAYLAFLEITKPATGSTVYTGNLYMTSTAS